MTRKIHIWIGVTLLVVIVLNYALIAYPLSKKSSALREKVRSVVMSKSYDDEYFLELYRKEKLAVDKKMTFVNAVGISLAVLVFSWTVFGAIMPRRK